MMTKHDRSSADDPQNDSNLTLKRRTIRTGDDLKPLLYDISDLSVLLHRSVPSLRRDDTAGRLPAAIWLGGSKRWNASDIEEWVRAAMPDRQTWEIMKDQNNR